MRPSPKELMTSVERLLRAVVIPDLHSDVLRGELKHLLGVIRNTPWDDAATVVREENARLRAALAVIEPLTTFAPELRKADLATATFEQLNARNGELRAALHAAVVELEVELNNTTEPTASTMRHRLVEALFTTPQ